ncbi:MAG: hypothetical protein QM758_26040 [Armatimonas sp.]
MHHAESGAIRVEERRGIRAILAAHACHEHQIQVRETDDDQQHNVR